MMAARGVCDAPLGRLHLEPVARPLAGTVWRVCAFRDDALDAVLGARIQRIGDGAMQSRDDAPRRPAQFEPFEQGATPGCTNDDDADGCRGRELRHEGDPTACTDWFEDGCNYCGVH
jgi:hypothetical protein